LTAPPAGLPGFGGYGRGTLQVSPDGASRYMRMEQHFAHSPEAAKEMQKFAELEAKSRHLAQQIQSLGTKDAPEEEKTKQREDLRKQLEDTVRQAFETRQKVQQLEVDQLKERLSKVERSLEKRQAKQDDIISDRIDELLNENQDLRWNPQAAVPGAPPAMAVRAIAVAGERAAPTSASPYGVAPVPAGAGSSASAPTTPARAKPPAASNAHPALPPLESADFTGRHPLSVLSARLGGGSAFAQQQPLLNYLADTRKALIDTEFAVEQAERQLKRQEDRKQTERDVPEADIERARAELEHAKRHVERVRLEYQTQLQLMEVNVHSAGTRLEAAERDYARIKSLSDARAVSQEEVDAKRTAVELAKTELEYAVQLRNLHQQAGEGDKPDPNRSTR
jgi:hypothetical protein